MGAISLVTGSPAQREATESQLRMIIRPMYSNPPIHGARLVSEVLGDASLEALWRQEVKAMADRIASMRSCLRSRLSDMGSRLPWQHITSQIGMFCFTGLQAEQVERLTREFHVYLTKDGRISIAGINKGNVDHLAKAIHEVTKSSSNL